MTMNRGRPEFFTMRKDSAPKPKDWFRIENKKNTDSTSIYIYDEIGMWGTSASDFIAQLNEVETKEIHLHLNSPGGQIFDGLAIYNSLKDHDAKVITYVDALAASAASFIAQAGDEIVMMSKATMMIHDGSAICFGNAKDMRDTADILDRFSDNIAGIYSDRAGKTVGYWRDLMKEETWFSDKEAVTFGLADRVDGAEDEDAEDAVDQWDLTAFNYAGRDKAWSPAQVQARVMLNSSSTKESSVGTNKAGAKNENDPNKEEKEEVAAGIEKDGTQEDETSETSTEGAQEKEQTSDPEENAQNKTGASNSKSTPVSGVMIDGELVTDYSRIQKHMEAQSNALTENKMTHRREFVENLAKDKKILATQVEEISTFVAGLSNEQWSAWSGLQNSAQPMSLLDNHGTSEQNTGSSSSSDKQDRIDILKGTVDMLRHSMNDDQITKTTAYQELQTLLADKE